MKIVQILKDSNSFLKGVKQKNKRRISKHVVGTLGASLLGNLLSGKGIAGAGSGNKKEK